MRNHAGFQQSKEYCLSDDSDGPLQRRYRESQRLSCSLWMRPTQNCLLRYLQQNIHEAIRPSELFSDFVSAAIEVSVFPQQAPAATTAKMIISVIVLNLFLKFFLR